MDQFDQYKFKHPALPQETEGKLFGSRADQGFSQRWGERGVTQKPERFVDQLAGKMSASDQSLLAAPDTLAKLIADLREALRKGTAGMADDLCVLSRPWGFLLENIRVPVHIWPGAHDQVIDPRIGLTMGERMPGAQCRLLEDGAHMIPLTHAAQIRAEIGYVSS
ncbi:alpha/beta fold hydrolase [Acidithiobacillus sp.]